MNKKERLLRILNGEATDRPPVICPGGMMNPCVTELIKKHNIEFVKANSDGKTMAALSKLVVDEKLFENYAVPFCMSIEAEAMGAVCDMGSDICEPHIKKYIVKNLDINSFKKIDYTQGRPKAVLEAISILKNDEIPVIGNVPGPFSVGTSVVEPLTVYVALKKQKETAHEFFNFIAEETGRFALEQVRAGADLITISDPSGTGEILGPKFFDEYMVTYMNKMIDIIRKDKPVPIIVHICGQMKKVFELLNIIKADAFSFDAIVSLQQAKEKINRPVMGNISTYALENLTPDKIKQMAVTRVKQRIDIIAPACGLAMNSKLENIKNILIGVEDAASNSEDSR